MESLMSFLPMNQFDLVGIGNGKVVALPQNCIQNKKIVNLPVSNPEAYKENDQ